MLIICYYISNFVQRNPNLIIIYSLLERYNLLNMTEDFGVGNELYNNQQKTIILMNLQLMK
jgi:hypothetical protein